MWHSLSSAQDELARSLNSFTRRTEAELTAARARLAEVESLQQLISSASKGDAASLFEIYQKAIKSNRYGTTDHLVAGVNRLPFLFAAAALNHVEALELVAIKTHNWHVQQSCAVTGAGLLDGLQWIAQRIRNSAKPAAAPP